MSESIFFKNITENESNSDIIKVIERLVSSDPNLQVYLINAPLGEKYTYPYQDKVIVILEPRHKIMFLNLGNEQQNFEYYVEDFIQDLNSLSDKFQYKNHLGRPREWQNEITSQITYTANSNIEEIFKSNLLPKELQRKSELLISLLIGSINDIEKIGIDIPKTILERVKKNIILFDGDQTRFIYKDYQKKQVSIQGLSGTGKTELLLHKLKELYIKDENTKIFFTCHNKALENTLKSRIPAFFNFMKVEKQIEWNKRLWVNRAWGSEKDINSGIYSYLCNFYKVPFQRYGAGINYNVIFTKLLEAVNRIQGASSTFDYAFDYILIDERQDFPKVFFELCEKVTKNQVFIAGDVFQNIFDNVDEDVQQFDVILNRCYRTDPRTLMFSHAIGLGLFDKQKINWFPDSVWESIGYIIDRKDNPIIKFSREPLRRFIEIEKEISESVIIKDTTNADAVIAVLKEIKSNHPDVKPSDIAIILVEDDRSIYDYIDLLTAKIEFDLEWSVNRAIETKSKRENELFLSNSNNAKGLEFPFSICITKSIKSSIRFRNTLYTMLTRSFIQSYLFVDNSQNLDANKEGLSIINSERVIKTIQPNETEINQLKANIKRYQIEVSKEGNLSYKDWLQKIFEDQSIDKKFWDKFEKSIVTAEIEKFEEDQTIKYILVTKPFICK